MAKNGKMNATGEIRRTSAAPRPSKAGAWRWQAHSHVRQGYAELSGADSVLRQEEGLRGHDPSGNMLRQPILTGGPPVLLHNEIPVA